MKTLSQKIMAFAFMLLSVTISAFADTWKDPSTGITWTYTVLDDGTVALGGGTKTKPAVPASTTGNLTVPAQINGLDVTSVMPFVFYNCSKITSIIFEPASITLPKDASYMFYNCNKLTDIQFAENWDTSNVTNMSYLFSRCWSISDLTPLANWNVSNVNNMSYLFNVCTKISDLTPLANWNVSNVNNMGYLFNYCTGISDLTPLANWNVSNVNNMSYLFYNYDMMVSSKITDLTPLANWNVSNVNNMESTFQNCVGITDLTPLANWNVSNVNNMSSLFSHCTGITDLTPLANWDVSNVNNMSYLFCNCKKITNMTGLANWNVSNVNNMKYMFVFCKDTTNTDFLLNWNVSKVTDMSFMFGYLQSESINISKWDVTGKDLKAMFSNGVNEKGSIYNINANRIIKRIHLPQKGLAEIPKYMFDNCIIKEITIPSCVTSIDEKAFRRCFSLREITIPSKVNSIGKGAFEGCYNLAEVYCMASNPPSLATDAFGSTTGEINKTLYVKSSAIEAYKADPQWSRFTTITDIIPIVIGTGKNYATLSFDFDTDFSETEGIQPYIASKYLEGEEAVEYLSGFEAKKRLAPGLHKAASSVNQDVKLIVLARYPNGYVPSRTGEDNFDFHGIILYGQPGTYYFKMGEQDFASDNQKTVTWSTNYMKSAYESWLLNPTYDHEPINWMEYPKEDTYNFVLKNNLFKYIDNAGTINRHKSWLELPAEKVSGTYFEAGAKMISLFDPDDSDSFATGLSFVVEDEPSEIQSRYNLNGQKVDANYKGVVIVNGKKLYNK